MTPPMKNRQYPDLVSLDDIIDAVKLESAHGAHRQIGFDKKALTRSVPEQRDQLRSETRRPVPARVLRTRLPPRVRLVQRAEAF
jgi:hypothetical protein